MEGFRPNPRNVPEAYHGLIKAGYSFDFTKYLREGLRLFRDNLGPLLVISAAITLLNFATKAFLDPIMAALPVLEPGQDLSLYSQSLMDEFARFAPQVILINLGYLVLAAPFFGSLYLSLDAQARAKSGRLSDIKLGFEFFAPLALAAILTNLLLAISFYAFVLPMVYLAVAYRFVVPAIVLLNVGIWQSMETSRKVISIHWWSFLLLFGLLWAGPFICNALVSQLLFPFGPIIVNIGSSLIQWILTPLVAAIIYLAFASIFGLSDSHDSLDGRIEEIGTE